MNVGHSVTKTQLGLRGGCFISGNPLGTGPGHIGDLYDGADVK